jgi:hypothetical protein
LGQSSLGVVGYLRLCIPGGSAVRAAPPVCLCFQVSPGRALVCVSFLSLGVRARRARRGRAAGASERGRRLLGCAACACKWARMREGRAGCKRSTADCLLGGGGTEATTFPRVQRRCRRGARHDGLCPGVSASWAPSILIITSTTHIRAPGGGVSSSERGESCSGPGERGGALLLRRPPCCDLTLSAGQEPVSRVGWGCRQSATLHARARLGTEP